MAGFYLYRRIYESICHRGMIRVTIINRPNGDESDFDIFLKHGIFIIQEDI